MGAPLLEATGLEPAHVVQPVGKGDDLLSAAGHQLHLGPVAEGGGEAQAFGNSGHLRLRLGAFQRGKDPITARQCLVHLRQVPAADGQTAQRAPKEAGQGQVEQHARA